MAEPRHALTQRSKGQGHRGIMHTWCVYACRYDSYVF